MKYLADSGRSLFTKKSIVSDYKFTCTLKPVNNVITWFTFQIVQNPFQSDKYNILASLIISLPVNLKMGFL